MEKGGNAFSELFVEGSISVALVAGAIASYEPSLHTGAHSLFLGQVRADERETGRVEAIRYTAYIPMAVAKADEIARDTALQFGLQSIRIVHSLGEVPVGGISLLVMAVAKHRVAAIEACAHAVERIKKELPVWGEEILANGHALWKLNT
jgi:molybdopterin synthase catalytic subunit